MSTGSLTQKIECRYFDMMARGLRNVFGPPSLTVAGGGLGAGRVGLFAVVQFLPFAQDFRFKRMRETPRRV